MHASDVDVLPGPGAEAWAQADTTPAGSVI
jgi:hypothetical protein